MKEYIKTYIDILENQLLIHYNYLTSYEELLSCSFCPKKKSQEVLSSLDNSYYIPTPNEIHIEQIDDHFSFLMNIYAQLLSIEDQQHPYYDYLSYLIDDLYKLFLYLLVYCSTSEKKRMESFEQLISFTLSV